MSTEPNDVEMSVIMLGTGQTLKRSDIDVQAPPPKPPRTGSVVDLLDDTNNDDKPENSLNEMPESPPVHNNLSSSSKDNELSHDRIVTTDIVDIVNNCSSTIQQNSDMSSTSPTKTDNSSDMPPTEVAAVLATFDHIDQNNLTKIQSHSASECEPNSNQQPTEPDQSNDPSSTEPVKNLTKNDDSTVSDQPPETESGSSNDVLKPTTDVSDVPQQPDTSPSSTQDSLSWLHDVELVDHTDTPISLDRLSSADVLAFYFSASWCPPCKTFLPNLKKFYTALRDNNKSFEMIYVSSDYSREEMVAYMSETSMPWTAIRYGHKLADKLRQDYTVRVIPILVVVSQSGKLLEENAKKQVDKAASSSSSTAACIQLYSNWVDKITNPFATTAANVEEEPAKQKTGVLNSIKKALSKDEIVDKKAVADSNSTDEIREMAESKTPKSKINSGGNKEELIRQLQEKENVIRQLEEVNLSLKHTNDDLNNEVRNLKSKVELLNDEVKSLRETDAQKKEDDEMFKEYLKLQGWLFKRGVKGPTANKWRRRYFRLDQGSKLYYYKNHTEGTPQGYIDLLKVISVMELNSAQQDKNNASFNIECEGRTYQLQAYDEAEMRRWITAISKLKEFYRKQQAEAAHE